MGIINKLFGSSSKESTPKKELPWQALTRIEQLDALTEQSKRKPVVIFKHSTRCGTSSMALRQFERHYNVDNENIELYFLDLLAYRDISNEVAIRFQVLHQSPQIIIIKDGVTVYHASDYQIQAEDIERFV